MVDFFTYDESDTTDSFHFWYNTTYKTLPSTTSFDDEVGLVAVSYTHLTLPTIQPV